jgi:hypothetical protein
MCSRPTFSPSEVLLMFFFTTGTSLSGEGEGSQARVRDRGTHPLGVRQAAFHMSSCANLDLRRVRLRLGPMGCRSTRGTRPAPLLKWTLKGRRKIFPSDTEQVMTWSRPFNERRSSLSPLKTSAER